MAKKQGKAVKMRVGLKIRNNNVDPKIMEEVERTLKERFKDHPRGLGFCHIYWAAKKRLLKEKYGIDWKTPAEQNPGVIID